MENKVAGAGQYSHEVPSEVGRVVLMRDGHHNGTEVYRLDTGWFRFVSLDTRTIGEAQHCALVRLSAEAYSMHEPYAIDLESPDGLALLGFHDQDDPSAFGEVLWSSAAETVDERLARESTEDEREARDLAGEV